VCKEPTCARRSQLYEWSNVFQSFIAQLIKNQHFIYFFFRDNKRKPQLEEDLYQRLKELVQQEDEFINDNSKRYLEEEADSS